MSSDLLQTCDQRTIDIVFGYIKSLEITFKTMHLPQGIKQICLMYYYINEFFSKAQDTLFKISEDKLTITNIRYCSFGSHTIYGKVWIPSVSKSIHKWTFSIHVKAEMYIGIASNDDNIDSDFSSDLENDIPNYALSNYGSRYKNGERFYDEFDTFITGFRHYTDVTLILDLCNAHLSYGVNDNALITVFDDIHISKDIKYIMALQTRMPNDSVTITNYTVDYNNQ
eukprot:432295_1